MIEAEDTRLGPTAQGITLIIVGTYCVYRLFSDNPFNFMHNIHLPIHEAGHLFFTPLGEFMHFLGGSFFQIFFPFCFTLSFAWRKDWFASLITLVWVGDSIIDISFYIGDAWKQQMPLIGGEHDWAYLLGVFDIMHHAEIFGSLAWWAGALTLSVGYILALIYAFTSTGWIKISP